MIRLRRDDFEDPHELARFAATCGMTVDTFRERFAELVELEPPPLDLHVMRQWPAVNQVSEVASD